ncbi:hypothetical protein TM239_01840 [Bradyrhizobium sp. TM239]|nr:hypothetical protein TM239_01840 [Bradyrhizobium sp. TM239]
MQAQAHSPGAYIFCSNRLPALIMLDAPAQPDNDQFRKFASHPSGRDDDPPGLLGMHELSLETKRGDPQ